MVFMPFVIGHKVAFRAAGGMSAESNLQRRLTETG